MMTKDEMFEEALFRHSELTRALDPIEDLIEAAYAKSGDKALVLINMRLRRLKSDAEADVKAIKEQMEGW